MIPSSLSSRRAHRTTTIHDIPQELLTNIFNLCCEDRSWDITPGGAPHMSITLKTDQPNPLQIATKLTHVCSPWRNFLLADPRFWTPLLTIPWFNHSLEWFNEIFGRTKAVSGLWVRCSPHNDRYVVGGVGDYKSMLAMTYNVFAEVILPLLEAHAHRITRLCLNPGAFTPLHMEDRRWGALSRISADAEIVILSTAHRVLNGSWSAENPDDVLSWAPASIVAQMHAQNLKAIPRPFVLMNLRELVLCDVHQPIQDIFQMLAYSPQLELLFLQSHAVSNDAHKIQGLDTVPPLSGDNYLIDLPRLSKISIYGMAGLAFMLLARIKPRRHRVIDIHADVGDEFDESVVPRERWEDEVQAFAHALSLSMYTAAIPHQPLQGHDALTALPTMQSQRISGGITSSTSAMDMSFAYDGVLLDMDLYCVPHRAQRVVREEEDSQSVLGPHLGQNLRRTTHHTIGDPVTSNSPNRDNAQFVFGLHLYGEDNSIEWIARNLFPALADHARVGALQTLRIYIQPQLGDDEDDEDEDDEDEDDDDIDNDQDDNEHTHIAHVPGLWQFLGSITVVDTLHADEDTVRAISASYTYLDSLHRQHSTRDDNSVLVHTPGPAIPFARLRALVYKPSWGAVSMEDVAALMHFVQQRYHHYNRAPCVRSSSPSSLPCVYLKTGPVTKEEQITDQLNVSRALQGFEGLEVKFVYGQEV